MDNKEVILLKKALNRQIKARKQAEGILEKKSKELYDTAKHLKEVNSRLENMLSEKSSELDGVFTNIIDPYVVIDLFGNVMKMNNSAKEFLGFDNLKENQNLTELVHQDYLEYTIQSFKTLIEVGTLKNYRAKIVIKNKEEKFVEINSCLIYDNNRKPIGAQGIIRDISQETEIKELLGTQRKQLDIIVENSPLSILLVDDQKIIKANGAFLLLLGYTDLEIKKQTINSIATAENKELADILCKKLHSGEIETYSTIKKYLKKDGSSILGKTSVSAVKNQSGTLDYQVIVIEDITKEIEAKEQVKASENRLSSLIANLHTGILVENENRKIELTNKMFCNIFDIKISPERLKGIDCSKAMNNTKNLFKNPDVELLKIETILKNKKLVLADELLMQDGRILERDYIPIFSDGNYNGHLWAYTDITLSKNYKKNIEAEKEKYRSIIANMNLGLIEIDENFKVQMVNNSFSKMSGYSEYELLNNNAIDVIYSKEKEKIKEKMSSRLDGKSDSYEIEICHKDGSKKHWLISGAPRYDHTGKIIGSLGINLDITNQKRLEIQKEKLVTELEKSNLGLQEYAHIVSHDLKSPLRSISALCTWLYEDYINVLDDNGKNNLSLMQEKVEAMDNLIDGILKYSTINSDNIENDNVDVNEVIKEITDIIYIPEHVKVVVVNKLPIINADRTKIHQLIQNFLSNAVVHIERKEGLVEIACKDVNTHWQFSVKDNGVGIPKEYHEKIFKIFESVGNKERSTGIGLSIVKKIIDLYNGNVWLESEIGIGTTFYFTIEK
ncbi:PAS domain S-box protein [Cellulophaga sp. HaHaR_3_176]|uniref:PAS domain-containing sensor histidine kinase n=1 Tax=Cellulophaga sp. HaHaR_3_176 TaxID=1942464 RepID=UPI001C1FF863|nr:PAS domain S-box protein [Cellulophaga sp. HaHaR_3_176]QWX84756.1 PAS domain S-box protein [Cellulophaga sp. HaHaR_3_176]